MFFVFLQANVYAKAEENNLFRKRMTLSLMPVLAVVFHLVWPPRSLKPGLQKGIQMLMRGSESKTGLGPNRHGKHVCTKTQMQTNAYKAELGSKSSMGKWSSSSKRHERSESERPGMFIED